MSATYDPTGNVAKTLLIARGVPCTPEVVNALRILFAPAETADDCALESLVILAAELLQQADFEIARGKHHQIGFSPFMLKIATKSVANISDFFAGEGI